MKRKQENGFCSHQIKSKANMTSFGGSVLNADKLFIPRQNVTEKSFIGSAEDAEAEMIKSDLFIKTVKPKNGGDFHG